MKALSREAEAFENGGAYFFETEREPRSTDEIVHRCFVTERQTPPDWWPLLAGEALYNLRCALDHIITAATPPEFANATQFPIHVDESAFIDAAKRRLRGVPNL